MGFFELFSSALAGFYALIPSYGLAIILLTVTVRVILLPLSIKQTRSMREMSRIQPEIKKLQAKYKANRQKMNEELMKLYKEHNVNPFGGCLPLLMQFPVLIGLFYVIREPLKYMGYRLDNGTNWVPTQVSGILERVQGSDLATSLDRVPEAVNNFLGTRLDCSAAGILSPNPDAVPIAGPCPEGVTAALPYLVFVLAMGFTTYYQQKQLQASRQGGGTDKMAQQMQMFAKIMPVMLMVFAYSFPLGVVLYWLTTNVWTIGQQQLTINKMSASQPGASAARPAKPSVKGAGPGAGKKGKESSPDGEAKTPTKAGRPHPSSKKKKKR